MIILAIDTSATATAALTDGETVLAEWSAAAGGKHAELTGPAVRELTEGRPAPELVVTGVGPGPFTGLRAGIATAIGYSLGAAIPAAGVPSHLALAVRAYRSLDQSAPLLAATDARRKEVYWTRFSGLDEHGVPVAAAGPEVSAPSDLAAHLTELAGQQAPAGIGGGFELYPELLAVPEVADPILDTAPPAAASLAIAAHRILASGSELWPTTPLYLRAPDAAAAVRRETSLR
ncbi:tRNA (adenosine(37)-N6)-threonylcarbamoyltransferase complex dimerization subunit type 1 TsaB [Brevibacterium luteolum]|uniref:tRNA (adenosine(37)-N6)-threonylcarbamoyltransferase complex dimerization subunit type 1 TsaB n=1 Tax=Brevibacterium luteolum TaxID=199591 RepID=UPI0021AF5567|nr:tRNA (adenosine(37)-N6)-threonylcarbamoyltransferase complex dimerization subunit type 1 TsaB [Brevibacterium luteolum]MCT1656722.1 tRNA (adenosine(37)-N6)-threonylcarbamoyltransferase complex dimerization subunit type 1 TsaB [Brevibacterium luteolum]